MDNIFIKSVPFGPNHKSNYHIVGKQGDKWAEMAESNLAYSSKQFSRTISDRGPAEFYKDGERVAIGRHVVTAARNAT